MTINPKDTKVEASSVYFVCLTPILLKHKTCLLLIICVQTQIICWILYLINSTDLIIHSALNLSVCRRLIIFSAWLFMCPCKLAGGLISIHLQQR